MVTSKKAPVDSKVAKRAVAKAVQPAIPPAEAADAAMAATIAALQAPEPRIDAPKTKLIRDSFTMPKSEYDLLAQLKGRLALLALPAKKSELLRAGIGSLALMSDDELREALRRVPILKTGRPGKDKDKGEGRKDGKRQAAR